MTTEIKTIVGGKPQAIYGIETEAFGADPSQIDKVRSGELLSRHPLGRVKR